MRSPVRACGGVLIHLLVFEVAGRRLGLLASAVREVIRAVAIAPLLKAPPIVEGLIDFRGTLVPVLDLRHRFGLPPAPLLPEQHFIVAQAGSRIVALRADRASDFVSLPKADVESPSGLVPGLEYLAGIARAPDGLLVVHDLETFLSLDEAGRLDAAIGEGTR